MIKVKVEVRPGAFQSAAKRLREIAKQVKPHEVTVGLHAAEGAEEKKEAGGRASGISLAAVAAIHEFGAGAVPDRSWLRTWVDQNRSRLEQQMVGTMHADYTGDKTAIERVAARWRDELRAWIAEQQGGLESLHPSTVAHKIEEGLPRPEVPLYATGQLVAAIQAELDGGRT